MPQRVAGERARALRELAATKGEAYRATRVGGDAEVTLEAGATLALTGDYLRVAVAGPGSAGLAQRRLHRGVLRSGRGGPCGDLYIDLSQPIAPN